MTIFFFIFKNKDKGDMLLQIVTVVCTKLRLKLFMKNSTKIKSYLTLIIVPKIQNNAKMEIT